MCGQRARVAGRAFDATCGPPLRECAVGEDPLAAEICGKCEAPGVLGCLTALSPMISLKSVAFPREGEGEGEGGLLA